MAAPPLADVAGLIVRNTFLENARAIDPDSDSDLDLGPTGGMARAVTEPSSAVVSARPGAGPELKSLGTTTAAGLMMSTTGGDLKRPASAASAARGSLFKSSEKLTEEDSCSDFEEPAYIFATPSGFQRQTTDEDYFFGQNLLPLNNQAASRPNVAPGPCAGPTTPASGVAESYMMYGAPENMMSSAMNSPGMYPPKDPHQMLGQSLLDTMTASAIEANANLIAANNLLVAQQNGHHLSQNPNPMGQQGLGHHSADAKAAGMAARDAGWFCPSQALPSRNGMQNGTFWPPPSRNQQMPQMSQQAHHPTVPSHQQQPVGLQMVRPRPQAGPQPVPMPGSQPSQGQKGQRTLKPLPTQPPPKPPRSEEQGTNAQAKSETNKSWAAHGPVVLQQAIVESIRNMECSLTLADIAVPDQPLIGCSDGFEKLTGYPRSEVLGRNCRFLHKGMSFNGSLRKRLREAVHTGTEFLGVLPNLRKNGERFQNLFHLASLKLRDRTYLLGIQADASHIAVDPRNAGHREAFKEAARRITAGHLESWMLMQAREFSMRLRPSEAEFHQLVARKSSRDSNPDDDEGAILRLGPSPEDEIRIKGIDSKLQRMTSSTDSTDVGKNSSHNSDSLEEKSCPAVRPRSVSTDDAMPGAEQNGADQPELKSMGSVGHPDTCTECCFHFFGPNGCRAGENCDYCHEFHPRKNKKKNRRLIRRLANPTADGGDEAQEDPANPTERTGGPDVPMPAPATPGPVPSSPVSPVAPVSKGKAADETNPRSEREPEESKRERVNIALSYCASTVGAIHLPVGVKAQLVPQVSCSPERAVVASSRTFSIEPPLPPGLTLDVSTGCIYGSPSEAEELASYTVTVKLDAVQPDGDSSPDAPAARCTFELAVLNLSNFSLFLSPGSGPGEKRAPLFLMLDA